jgi:hypothetical protein
MEILGHFIRICIPGAGSGTIISVPTPAKSCRANGSAPALQHWKKPFPQPVLGTSVI